MFRLIACVRVRANRLAAKDCRAVIIEQRFLTPGHHEDSPRVAVSILTKEIFGGVHAFSCSGTIFDRGMHNVTRTGDLSLSRILNRDR